MLEKKPITNLPDLSDLPPDVQEFVRGLAEDGIEVRPGRPHRSRSEPGPFRMLEDEPIVELPDLSDLPPDLQEFVKGLAREGIEVTLGRPDPNRIMPEPLRANTSLTAAVLEEREEYGW